MYVKPDMLLTMPLKEMTWATLYEPVSQSSIERIKGERAVRDTVSGEKLFIRGGGYPGQYYYANYARNGDDVDSMSSFKIWVKDSTKIAIVTALKLPEDNFFTYRPQSEVGLAAVARLLNAWLAYSSIAQYDSTMVMDARAPSSENFSPRKGDFTV